MAARADLEFTYSTIDRIVRLSLGENADFSGAKYDGDFSLSLEEAQRRKHVFIAEQLGIGPGSRAIDLGCGWGGMLRYLREIGATGIGLTLSSAQARACRRHGFVVHVKDCRTIEPSDVGGMVDAAISVGSFEHFCSPDDYAAGRQEETYRRIFESVAAILPPGGRFFVQTMVFGEQMIPADEISVEAPRDSDAWHLALMTKLFPGSWLPYGYEQLEQAAAPYFRLIHHSSGRTDYLETIRQWRRRFARPGLRKTALKLSLLPRYLVSRDFRLAFASGVSANSVCFERDLMNHFRLVFEKKPGTAGAAGPTPASTLH
jgi:cyclopropane-fatty-acyl-phospholipid synthase